MPLRALAFFVCCFAALLSSSAGAATTRILFIGNSLTSSPDVPARVAKLAAATGRSVDVATVAFPDFSLDDHRKDGRALEAIRHGWDVVVLQQGTSARPASRAELIESMKYFAKEIRAAGARPALFMAWATEKRRQDFPPAIQNHRDAAAAANATLLPVGEAWLRVLMKDRGIELYSDALHASADGAALAAMTIYMGLLPAGPDEFTEEYARKMGRALELKPDKADLFLDAATRAIDEPLPAR